ncbi:MAG: histidine kinase dimerization/phospho-acceptor domain-containing protein [Terriglobia bacterium]
MLVLSQAEEVERLRERWATRAPDFHLLTAPGIAEVLPHLAEWQADALVCDLTVLSAGDAATLLNPAEPARRVPVVALLSPGMEERAATLLTQGLAECVVKVGNYDLLLAATLRQLIRNPTPGSAAAARQGGRAAATLDFKELGMILRHEINNPLTGILGNAELILASEPQLAAEVRRRVETIVTLSVRLRDLVRNLEQTVSGQGGQGPVRPSSAGLVLESPADPAPRSKSLR